MTATAAVTDGDKARNASPSAALLCAALLAWVGGVQAAQDAHEHGKGELNVIVEGAVVALELHVPGVDVVGFEHKARTKQEKAAVATALQRFSSPGPLFELSAAARCMVTGVEVSLGGEHVANGKAKKDAHGHVDEHDAHDKEDAHSDLRAEYYFECAAPARLQQLVVNVFDVLSANALRAAVITGQRQTASDLTPADRTIDFTF